MVDKLTGKDEFKIFFEARPALQKCITNLGEPIPEAYLHDPFANDYGFQRLLDIVNNSMTDSPSTELVSFAAANRFSQMNVSFYSQQAEDPRWVQQRGQRLHDVETQL
ncbi:MAG: hypothetical protein WCL08_11885, partial [Verrucomicrobiota bacterium]